MSRVLAIYGGGGHGKVVADTAERTGEWNEIVFFDDAYPEKTYCGRWNIIGKGGDLYSQLSFYEGVIVAVGSNKTRLAITEKLISEGALVVSIIDPTAVISKYAEINIGSVVFANTCINVDCFLGIAVIVNTGAVLEHDCNIGQGAHISPNATLGGGVIVGECGWVGINASVRQLVNMGAHCIVGAGSVVVSDVSDFDIVTGCPAKPIKKSVDVKC